MNVPDNYSCYLQHERQLAYEYERYRQMYLDGDIDEEEWNEIEESFYE
jgi:hypothetical protein